MPLKQPRRAGMLLITGQTISYNVGDDGDIKPGLAKRYEILTAGQYAGTTNIDIPHYANNGLSFVAPNQINDAGAGLVTFLATDTILVRGSLSNDGVYTVSVGGVAGQIITVQNTIVNEGAGRYITLCKRSSPSNNCVMDLVTGRMWRRYHPARVGAAERIGIASDGALNWYNTVTCYTLHPAAGDLQMMVTGIKVVGGAAELPRYFVGMILDLSGFATPVNNLPGYRITAIAVNGADLDITLWTGKNTLVAEAAAGARDIRLICQSIFSYAGAVNAAMQGGYSDWRVANNNEYYSLANLTTAIPDAVAFPNWGAPIMLTSNTNPGDPSQCYYMYFGSDAIACTGVSKANFLYPCALVRP